MLTPTHHRNPWISPSRACERAARKRFCNRRRANQKGQSLVESTLIFLLFIVVFLGIMDFGQFLYVHQALTDRVRAGVRFAAVHNAYTENQIQKFVVYGNSAADPSIAPPIVGGLTISMVELLRAGTPGDASATVTVRVRNFPFRYLSPYIAGSHNANLSATLPNEAP